jgi:prephenate dehydrogenase
MKMFNQVVIIGTGLIGGSIGIALKKQQLAVKVTGLSRNRRNAELAKRAGAIDQVARSLDVVSCADLVILATPVDTIMEFAVKISKLIKKDCLVIDVGSTKERIVSKLSTLMPNFVGCHPLAGSEKKGAVNLKNGIFKDSICLITPIPKTDRCALNKVKRLWKRLGAKNVVLSPKAHDQTLAFTSHLPHAVAFSLINSVPEKSLFLGSSGLKDTTRISVSAAGLWSQIFLTNRANILGAISAFQSQLAALKLAIKNNNKTRLIKILDAANKKREKLG